jgi:tetrahydromethanopterin S-methyltransferase subunit H
MFYRGHKILHDERTGDFDKQKAEEQIQSFLEFGDQTGVPIIIDVVGAYGEPLVKCCEFVAERADIPFLVDGLTDETRIYAIQKLIETGYRDRAVYNSIENGTSIEDCAKIKEIGVKNAVLLCFKSSALTPEKKINLLTSTDTDNPGLLEKVKLAGIQDYIVDVAVLDVPSISRSAGAIKRIKQELKIPVGCAPVNALAEWSNWKMFGKVGKTGTTTAAMSYILAHGADFAMYGSINKAKDVFPGIALLDSINAYYRKRVLKKEAESTSFMQKLR